MVLLCHCGLVALLTGFYDNVSQFLLFFTLLKLPTFGKYGKLCITLSQFPVGD
jgi:hypothetical protein